MDSSIAIMNPITPMSESDQSVWFASLRAEYQAACAQNEYFREELKVFDERHRFGFYSQLNPMWLMDHNERAGIYMLLSLVRPRVIIEIGARFAGTTSLFSKFAEHVYVVDIDPTVRERCKPLHNVTVTIGNSPEILPGLIEQLNASRGGWDFALVDGDHSASGVRDDLNALLTRRPLRRAYVAMHDSFNPECRKGILEADWERPWVSAVEVDFIIGNVMPQPHVFGELWGGLALGELSEVDREGPLNVTQTGKLAFEAAVRYRAELQRRPIRKRLRSRIARIVRGS